MNALGRHPRLTVLVAIVVAIAVAIPLVAYVIVPAFVRSTLVEALPTATPATSVSGSPAATASPDATPATLAKGELVRITAVDYGTGTVRVVQVGNTRFLRFEGVDIAGAPDMYVYLSDSSDGKPGSFVDLGKLKATNGSFNYEIPATVDLSGIRSVVVWCRQFSVTVTYAVLARS